jgi:hypothetical protein
VDLRNATLSGVRLPGDEPAVLWNTRRDAKTKVEGATMHLGQDKRAQETDESCRKERTSAFNTGSG